MTARSSHIITIGRRKEAVAKFKVIKKDADKLILSVNDMDFTLYFPSLIWQEIIRQPLTKVGLAGIEAMAKVNGGGKKSQAESIRLALSRALIKINPEVRSTLKKEGYLTRDPRIKERKKPGLKKARRAPQWSKR